VRLRSHFSKSHPATLQGSLLFARVPLTPIKAAGFDVCSWLGKRGLAFWEFRAGLLYFFTATFTRAGCEHFLARYNASVSIRHRWNIKADRVSCGWFTSSGTAMVKLVSRSSDASVAKGNYFASLDDTITSTRYFDCAAFFLPAIDMPQQSAVCPSKRGVMS
jgi:hypothetical protein